MGLRQKTASNADVTVPGMFQQLEVEWCWSNDVTGEERGRTAEDEARKMREARE